MSAALPDLPRFTHYTQYMGTGEVGAWTPHTHYTRSNAQQDTYYAGTENSRPQPNYSDSSGDLSARKTLLSSRAISVI